MYEEKSNVRKIRAKIQEGFFPQNAPLIRETVMAEDKKGRIEEGFVPQKTPLKPADKEDKGFVPQPSPRKPPEKPDTGKK